LPLSSGIAYGKTRKQAVVEHNCLKLTYAQPENLRRERLGNARRERLLRTRAVRPGGLMGGTKDVRSYLAIATR
jgi:hypothetical protein